MSQMVRRCWKSKFAHFVRSYGVEKLAKELRIAPSAVYHWIRAASRPKPEHAATIQRLARERGVRVTLDEIYAHSRDLRANDRTITMAIERRKIASATACKAPSAAVTSAHLPPKAGHGELRGVSA